MDGIDLMKELELPEEPKGDPGVFRVREYPDDMLQAKCLPWTADVQGDAELQDHIDSLENTLKMYRAAGISGPQVGIPYRIIVVATKDGPLTLINPVITGVGNEVVGDTEGCLSFPGLFIKVKRKTMVVVSYVDRQGAPASRFFLDQEARSVQHEIDHLDGVVFIDRIPKVMRGDAIRKWKLAPRVAKQRNAQLQKMLKQFQGFKTKKKPAAVSLPEEAVVATGGTLTAEIIDAAAQRMADAAGT